MNEKTRLAQRMIAARAIRGWLIEKVEDRYATIGAKRGGQKGVVRSKISEWEGSRERDGEPVPNEHQKSALVMALGVREDWLDAHPDELLGGSALDIPAQTSNLGDSEETPSDTQTDQATSKGTPR